jgi:peroxin-12
MAEAGAHLLTSTLEKPSIFEVVAADSLHSTFYPALKRMVNYIASLNPQKYGKLLKYYDEIFLVLNGVVQNYYLNRNCEFLFGIL